MSNDKKKLLKVAQELHRLSQYSAVSDISIKRAEKALEIIFPTDFKKFCTVYSYDYCRLFSFFSFDEGVIDKTLEWRKSVNFPRNCVGLAEEGESAIIMRITGDNAEVIWCSIPDLYNLCEAKPLEDNPTIFPTFTDFYSYLLDEEEKIREENKQ